MVIQNSSLKSEYLQKNRKKRKNKYIPGLARIKFEPDDDWSKRDALKLFNKQNKYIGEFTLDNIYYEDCIKGMRSLPEDSIDLIVADPPFGLNFSGKEAIYNRNADFVIDDYGEVKGDYPYFTKEWISQLPRIMKSTSSAYIFSGWTNLEYILRAIREVGLNLVNHVIWEYQFGVFTTKKFVTSHYHLLFIVKNPKNYYFNRIEHYTGDVWKEFKREYNPKKKKNGTKLPKSLIRRCIDFSSKPGDIVLDPFIGNGTTAETAKANYRHFLGFEINKKMEFNISNNLKEIQLGEKYYTYKSRIPKPESYKKQYPLAYKIYKAELLSK